MAGSLAVSSRRISRSPEQLADFSEKFCIIYSNVLQHFDASGNLVYLLLYGGTLEYELGTNIYKTSGPNFKCHLLQEGIKFS